MMKLFHPPRFVKATTTADKEGTSSLTASLKALHGDMVRRGIPPSTTTTKTRVKE
jgi:hypothetical protein